MKRKLRYLYLELKKTAGIFPRMLLQAILLMAIIGMIAFCGVKGMEREPLAVRADVGVAVREDSRMMRLALAYVENMESVSEVCRFVQVSEEEGRRMLKQGKIIALVILPEQIVEGILNGSNPSVDIVFPSNSGLEAMLFRELAKSGERLLQVAQAQIYGAGDMAEKYGLTDGLSVMETEIDSSNLAFALDRFALYDTKMLSATGRLGLWQFYAASGTVLFLLMAGMALYPVMQKEPKAFTDQLARCGTGAAWQCFSKWFCGVLCMLLFAGMLCLSVYLLLAAGEKELFRTEEGAAAALQLRAELAGAGNRPGGMAAVGTALLIVAAVTTFVFMIYSAAGSGTAGIPAIFLLGAAMVYLSGGLVPDVFLPRIVQDIGDKLPTAYLIRAAGGLIAGCSGGTLRQCIGGMSVYTAVFGAAAWLFRKRSV